jgi:hypothetical protein
MKKTIYIAGKISGLPYKRTYYKFLLRELYLWFMGFNPVNPMREIPKDWTWHQQVEEGKNLAIECDCIYLSHNWRDSKGAYRELLAYLRAGKKLIVYNSII